MARSLHHLQEILDSGRPPGFLGARTPWRSFVSTLHDGDTIGASKLYAANPEGVLAGKPKHYDDLKNIN